MRLIVELYAPDASPDEGQVLLHEIATAAVGLNAPCNYSVKYRIETEPEWVNADDDALMAVGLSD